MTRYEQGFLTKCAEYGVDGRYLLYKFAGIFSKDRGKTTPGYSSRLDVYDSMSPAQKKKIADTIARRYFSMIPGGPALSVPGGSLPGVKGEASDGLSSPLFERSTPGYKDRLDIYNDMKPAMQERIADRIARRYFSGEELRLPENSPLPGMRSK